MKRIPTQLENPSGLHQRYIVQKIIKNVDYDPKKERSRVNDPLKVVNVSKGSEYFIMRLDEGGKDINHIKACRIGVNAYADAIEPFIPELANDLRERYPLL